MIGRSRDRPSAARVLEVHPEGRDRECDEGPAREHECDHRPPEHTLHNGPPDAGLAAAAVAPAGDEGHAALLVQPLRARKASIAGRKVIEPSIATPTTRMVPRPKRHEDRVAGEQHARHGDHDREAGDEDGPAGGGGGDLDRVLRGTAVVALLHLAAEVEHRVVDADRQADETDDDRDGGVEGVQLAERAEEADGGDDRGRAEQQRDAGGDEGAEGDQQDDQRGGIREGLGGLLVLRVLLVEDPGGRRAAELLDADAGVRLLRRGDGGEGLGHGLFRDPRPCRGG